MAPLSVLQHHPVSPILQAEACKALTALASSHKSVRAALLAGGAAERVTAAITVAPREAVDARRAGVLPPGESGVFEACATARLAPSSARAGDMLIDVGTAMSTLPACAPVQEEGCRAIAAVAKVAAGDVLGRSRVWEWLYAAMDTHPEDVHVQEAALAAVCVVCSRSVETKAALVMTGCGERVSRALPIAPKAAAQALAALKEEEEEERVVEVKIAPPRQEERAQDGGCCCVVM